MYQSDNLIHMKAPLARVSMTHLKETTNARQQSGEHFLEVPQKAPVVSRNTADTERESSRATSDGSKVAKQLTLTNSSLRKPEANVGHIASNPASSRGALLGPKLDFNSILRSPFEFGKVSLKKIESGFEEDLEASDESNGRVEVLKTAQRTSILDLKFPNSHQSQTDISTINIFFAPQHPQKFGFPTPAAKGSDALIKEDSLLQLFLSHTPHLDCE